MFFIRSLRSVWTSVVVSVLVMSFMSPSFVYGASVTVTTNTTLVDQKLSGTNSFIFSSSEPLEFVLNILAAETGRISLEIDSTMKSPVISSITDFTFVDSYMYFVGELTAYSMYNFTRGTATITGGGYSGLILIWVTINVGATVYVQDVQMTKDSSYIGCIVSVRSPGEVVPKSGVHISRAATYKGHGIVAEESASTSWESITVNHCSVAGSRFGFYYRMNTIFQNNLLRFENCTYEGNTPFFKGYGSIDLAKNSNLVFSNVISKVPLFQNVNSAASTLTSTSKLTLYNVTASSLYDVATSVQLFSSVPKGAQVYVGLVKLDTKTYSTLTDYQSLNLPFTRVIDGDRKVLYIASGSGGSDKVGDNSSSHCAIGGYSRVALRLDPSSKTEKPMCICNADRFVPHCTTSFDPLGISLCPTDTTASETTYECIPCVNDRCRQCNEANKCVLCESEYAVDDQNKCTIPAANCKVPVSGSSTQCSVCQSGYSLSVGKKCVQSISNCKAYADSGACTSCQGTLSPSLSGASCVDCTMAGCAVCHADGKCSTCESKYSLVNDECVSCNLDHCNQCNQANKCVLCESGYAVDDQNKCTIPAANCKVPVGGSSTQCSDCQSGYSVSVGKKCVQSISNCKAYADSGACTSCQGTLSPSLSGASCVDCTMAGCAVCHADGKCSTCESKYSLVNDECVSCNLDHCNQCNQANKCVLCESGYAVDDQNKCTIPAANCKVPVGGSSTQCSDCQSGYSVSVGKKCVQSISNCKAYADSGACTSCQGTLSPSLSGASCVDCTMAGCTVCHADGKCSTCESKYSLVNDKCVTCNLENCVRCEEPNQCKECEDRFKVSGVNCIEKTCAKPPSTGCKSVSGNEDISVGCTSPHQLNPSTQQCDACIGNYKLGDDDVCIEKTCAKPPSTGCKSVSGNEDISVGCTSPHQLNPSTQQCDACIDNYKLGDDDVCIEKTCAKPPSTGCKSVSGNEDISVGCTSPHILNPSTQQCDACIDNYKLDEDDVCIEKTCAKPPSTGCKSVSGNEDISVGCTSPHQLNPSTQQCDACIDNYKMGDDDVCIEKTCAKPPSMGCNSVSGNEDISVGCTPPHILNSSTQQCDACEPGLKYIQENVTCVEKQCLVANCSKCVFDQEHQCNSCGDGLQVDGDSQCSAVKDEKKVSTGMLIGIIVAIVAVVIIAALLVFFLCCRKERRSYEAVEHVERKNTPAVKGNDLPSVEVEEETEVTILNPEGEGDERNPLLPTEEANEPPTVPGRRRVRRTRNVRRGQTDIDDIDLDAMYSKDNEIEEEIF